jgi:hypothetical protein
MSPKVVDVVRGTPLYRLALVPMRRAELFNWQRRGRTGVTPHIWKRRVLSSYASRYGLKTLVETGTYMGEMTAAMRNVFDEIYSIELSDALYAGAAKRFAGDNHVHVLHGDSSGVLRELLPSLATPCLFWLDAHYSAGVTARGDMETPVAAEIRLILANSVLDHIIVIDDADLFDGTGDYPSIQDVSESVARLRPSWSVSVREKLVRIHPREG